MRSIWKIIAVGFSIMGFTAWAYGQTTPLTDQQKKAIVYRMYAGYQKEFPEVADITPQQAMETYKAGHLVFVDTRKEAEMAVSMLPGAISEKVYLADPAAYQGKQIVAYCTVGYRSGRFAEKMAEQGVRVYNLKGGILAWVLEGGTVYDADGPTHRIHVYGKNWNYAPEGYTSVMFGFWDRLF